MNQGTFSDYHYYDYTDSDRRDLTSTMIGGWCYDYDFHPGIFSVSYSFRFGEEWLSARLSKNLFSIIQELGRGTLVLHTNLIIDYHRLDTNSSSAAFLYGGCHEYDSWPYRTTQGIFQYTQDDTLYFKLTGSTH